MAQLSKIVNTALISQTDLYLKLISQVCSVILMRKADENLLHQNLFVLLIKKKLIRKKLKLLQQRQFARKPRKYWYQLWQSNQWWPYMINGISPDDWWRNKIRFSSKKFFYLVDLLKTTIGPGPSTANFRSLSAAKKLAINFTILQIWDP